MLIFPCAVQVTRKEKKRKEKKRKEKTTPFGVILMRSQVLYRAAQVQVTMLFPHVLASIIGAASVAD